MIYINSYRALSEIISENTISARKGVKKYFYQSVNTIAFFFNRSLL